MSNGIRKPVALTLFTTTHHVPLNPLFIAIIDPLTGSPTTTSFDGRSVALVGPTLITPHFFVGPSGLEFHAPNPIIGPGTQAVKIDGLSVAFVGETFN
jgi:hypothetical protein